MNARSYVKVLFHFSLIFAGCFYIEGAATSANSTASSSSAKNIFDEATKALRLAVEGNNTAAAHVAIRRGANLESRDWWGWTPLHKAAWEGYTQVMDELLNAGANVEAETMGRNRPLHLAAWQGKNEAVSRLVKAGADLHAIGSLRQTPLKKADHYYHDSTVELLRSLGARE